jgi:chromosome segregation ATPase
MFTFLRGFSLAFHLCYVQFDTSMGLISDLLRDSPLKPEQLENIAVIEKRMQDEKLSSNRELDRLKAEFDRVRTELDQARSLVRMLEQEVAEWRRQIKSGFDDSVQPGAEAGS